jgi:hypothetical protein
MSIGLWGMSISEGHAQEALLSSISPAINQPDTPNIIEPGSEGMAVSFNQAATSTVTSTLTTATLADLNDQIVTFEELKFFEPTIRGPYQSESLTFFLPMDWDLTPGAEVKLDFVTFFGGVGNQPTTDTETVLGGSMEIFFNEVLLGKVVLDQVGERSMTFAIPPAALISPRPDGRHDFRLVLDGALSCDFNSQPTIVLQPTSHFILPHQFKAPPLDLRLLPRPIYQNSFIPDTAVIVVPDKPTAKELQAALAISAGFGEMSFAKLILSLIPIKELTPEIQEGNHLIFVGQQKAFPILNELSLPLPLDEAGFKATEIDESDGVIQMVASPWNRSKVVLLLSGSNAEAVAKAGQAVSSGRILVGSQPNIAVVSQVRAIEEAEGARPLLVDQTFATLGYSAVTRQGTEADPFEYRFEVPAGYVADSGAYLELVFNHSDFLNFEQSGLVVELNDQLIGNVSFSKESTNISKSKLTIPRQALRSGTNQLTIAVELMSGAECINPDLEAWVTIWPDSLIHLPLIRLPQTVSHIFELDEYPEPFALDASLRSTGFVLPPDDPTAWNIAAQVALDLGHRASTPLAELTVVIDKTMPEEVKQAQHLFLVGQPKMLPIVAELSDAMPVPFAAGTNRADEEMMRVSYRLPADMSLGYLQLFPSPWNKNRTVIAVLGTDKQGLIWAGAALTDYRIRYKLEDNFVIVQGDQIYKSDRDLLPAVEEALTAEIVPEAEGQGAQLPAAAETTAEAATTETTAGAVAAEPPAAAAEAESPAAAAEAADGPAATNELATTASGETAMVNQKPSWIVPLLGLSTTVMIAVIGIVFISSRRQSK